MAVSPDGIVAVDFTLTELAKPLTFKPGPSPSPVKKFATAAAFLLGLLITTSLTEPAFAQSSQGLFYQCGTQSGQPTYCPVSSDYALPVTPGINTLTPVAGTQVNQTINTAQGLTIPTGARVVTIQAQGTDSTIGVCAFFRDDGVSPNASAGIGLAHNATVMMKASSSIKLIQAQSATCTFTAAYYK